MRVINRNRGFEVNTRTAIIVIARRTEKGIRGERMVGKEKKVYGLTCKLIMVPHLISLNSTKYKKINVHNNLTNKIFYRKNQSHIHFTVDKFLNNFSTIFLSGYLLLKSCL